MTTNETSCHEHDNNRPRGTRTLDLILRSAHIAVTSAVFGGAVFGAPDERLLIWNQLAIVTGIALIALAVHHSRHWPYQVCGVLAAVHIALIGLVFPFPALTAPVLAAALVTGVIGSHLPKKYRHWSLVHKRVMD